MLRSLNPMTSEKRLTSLRVLVLPQSNRANESSGALSASVGPAASAQANIAAQRFTSLSLIDSSFNGFDTRISFGFGTHLATHERLYRRPHRLILIHDRVDFAANRHVDFVPLRDVVHGARGEHALDHLMDGALRGGGRFASPERHAEAAIARLIIGARQD